MDANIKTAASYLRRAISDLERRISEIRAREHNQQHAETRQEEDIKSKLHNTEAKIILEDTRGRENLNLAKYMYNLNKQRRQIREDLHRQIDAENQEIRALQGQISKLDSIARTLENLR